MMINILSASLPGRCITLHHCNASDERMRNTVIAQIPHAAKSTQPRPFQIESANRRFK